MKRKSILLLAIALFLPLCACFNAIPELNAEDHDKVVRYMADVVLEHDKNYRARLLDEEEKQKALEEEAFKAERLKKIEEEEKKLMEEKAASNSADDITTNYVVKSYGPDEINDYLGIENVEFEFAGEELVNKYPQNGDKVGLAYVSNEGKTLLVVKFDICNVSDENAYVDLFSLSPKFRIVINDNVKATSLKVPLEDVMNEYQETLDPRSVSLGVLIFEIPDDTVVETLDLKLSGLGKEAIKIKLK